MLSAEGSAAKIPCLEDGQRCLPQMTALFVNGLSGHYPNSDGHAPHTHRQNRPQIDTHRFSVLLQSQSHHRISKNEITSYCARIENPSCDLRNERPDGDLEKLRYFICGISNCFNNILMGIWGNVSLLSMTIDKEISMATPVKNMDRLIQNGALLIHSLFGYMAERRMATKHLRLVQLIHEINEGMHDTEIAIDIGTIEKGMELASQITRPSVVADGMARVLEQLLRWINAQLESAKAVSPKDSTIAKRLNTIDALLKQGFQIVRQLKLFTGSEKQNRRMISVKSLVKQQVRVSRKNFKDVQIFVDLSEKLRLLSADRGQLQFVLEQLITNAVSAMPTGGNIQVSARPIYEEAPEERCVVHQACEYTVITVSDNGVGMSTRTQNKIFTPFYARHRKSNPVGLGLAACSSIVKRHGGYIQVKSDKKRGSTFKIYLPSDERAIFYLPANTVSRQIKSKTVNQNA